MVDAFVASVRTSHHGLNKASRLLLCQTKLPIVVQVRINFRRNYLYSGTTPALIQFVAIQCVVIKYIAYLHMNAWNIEEWTKHWVFKYFKTEAKWHNSFIVYRWTRTMHRLRDWSIILFSFCFRFHWHLEKKPLYIYSIKSNFSLGSNVCLRTWKWNIIPHKGLSDTSFTEYLLITNHDVNFLYQYKK